MVVAGFSACPIRIFHPVQPISCILNFPLSYSLIPLFTPPHESRLPDPHRHRIEDQSHPGPRHGDADRGGWDGAVYRAVSEGSEFAEVDARREAIIKSLEERKLMTDVLRAAIDKATTLTQLEDAFAPYRPKRRTRATIAAEKGLTPLADWIQANAANPIADPKAEAVGYVNAGNEGVTDETIVKSVDDALSGARDILAERASDAAEIRMALRQIYENEATISSKVLTGKETDAEAAKFRDYFDWSESLKAIPSHRLLAIRRGEKDGFLLMRITIPEDRGIAVVQRLFAVGSGKCAEQMSMAAADSCKRLLFPSMETESRLNSKKRADAESVRVFSENLKDLMLAPALGEKRVLAIDPGFRTGCKVVVLTAQGALVHNDVIYPTTGQVQMVEAARTLLNQDRGDCHRQWNCRTRNRGIRAQDCSTDDRHHGE